jgi:Signal transduction histidine kinase
MLIRPCSIAIALLIASAALGDGKVEVVPAIVRTSQREFSTPQWLFVLLVVFIAVQFATLALLVASRRALRDREQRRYSLFEDSPVAMFEEDFCELKRRIDQERAAGREDWVAYFGQESILKECAALVCVLDANREMLRLLGASGKDEVVRGPVSLLAPAELEPLRDEFIAFASGSTSIEGEFLFAAGTERERPVQYKVGIVPGYERSWGRVLVSVVDLAKQKKAEMALSSSLAEKELLINEVHHRVKNNLQVICSLINLQLGDRDRDLPESRMLIEMENRVRAMALVHEELLKSSDLAYVDFSAYASSLCEQLFEVYAVDPARIRLEIAIDDLRLPLGTAVTCGLAINELAVNAIEHAFPGDRRGRISLSLTALPEGEALLEVGDDGVGCPLCNDMLNAASLEAALEAEGGIGLSLVRTLALQLKGDCEIRSSGGFSVRIRMPLP